MIPSDAKVLCGWCNDTSTAQEWDNESFSACTSREMRRAYTHIFKETVFSKQSSIFYKCPHCGMWSRGCQLSIVDTEDKRLLRLGHQPLIEEIK